MKYKIKNKTSIPISKDVLWTLKIIKAKFNYRNYDETINYLLKICGDWEKEKEGKRIENDSANKP